MLDELGFDLLIHASDNFFFKNERSMWNNFIYSIIIHFCYYLTIILSYINLPSFLLSINFFTELELTRNIILVSYLKQNEKIFVYVRYAVCVGISLVTQ